MDNESFYLDLINNIGDGVYFVNTDRVITFWNRTAEKITGFDRDHVIGYSCRDNILNHVTENGASLCENGCPLTACMKEGKSQEASVFLHHKDGHRVPVYVNVSPIYDSIGNIIGAVETFGKQSIELRSEIHDLREKVFFDHLTGTRNRQFLDTKLEDIIFSADRFNSAFGLLFIDIDHFKVVNDNYSHEIGDKTLKMVAKTLCGNVRQSDVVGRWGGEEFLILLNELKSKNSLERISEKIRALVECSSIKIGDSVISVTVSIGATTYRPGDTAKSIVHRADQLMYESKKAGRNRVTVG